MAISKATELLTLGKLVDEARRVAVEYYRLTGKPLGITGEVGEYEAARLLGLKLAPPRSPGFDATKGTRKYQIKSRAFPKSAQGKGQRIGSIKLDHKWDAVLLVILDSDDLKPLEIWEADRMAIAKVIASTTSRSNKRGALAISKFKSIGSKKWRKDIA
jgi:hypothetical protein